MPGHSPDSKEVGRYFALAMVGVEMVAPIVIGLLLDSSLGWTPAPWGVTCGAILGLVGGLYHLVILAKQFDRKDSSGRPREPQ
jgi:F0F1-type ATP synthase assembly protein I